MTVSELIAALSRLPANAPVYVYDDCDAIPLSSDIGFDGNGMIVLEGE